MSTLVVIVHVLVCVVLMLSVLLQAGKGGGMGAAFGGGGNTGTVFGGSGAGGFLRKITVGAATLFMMTAMSLAWLSSRQGSEGTDALQQIIIDQQAAQALKNKINAAAVSPDGGTPLIDAGTATSTDGGVLEKTAVDAGLTAAGDAGQAGVDAAAANPASKETPAPKKPAKPAKPAKDKPGTDKPAANKPDTRPAKDKPGTDKPAAGKPSADKPATNKPAADKPASDTPAGSTNKPTPHRLRTP